MALIVSNFRFVRSSCLGKCFIPSTNAVIPKGTLIANSQCQLAMERIPLATEGPAAAEIATTMALIPIPRPSWLNSRSAESLKNAGDRQCPE